MSPTSSEDGEGGPDAHGLFTALALSDDTSCIARARHHAADSLARVRAERKIPVSARALDPTQLVVGELVTTPASTPPALPAWSCASPTPASK
ncbi:hypothetical protein ACFWBR_28755 [Streptomyces sp. NPDC060006]|uniref:hypothetical protein n=1 Tax=unclassified Streptomyces TaxID=2593676 RepID=UPI0036A78619